MCCRSQWRWVIDRFSIYLHDVTSVFSRLDDLLVGAPLYSVKKDGRIIADAGRVDVFYQTADVTI